MYSFKIYPNTILESNEILITFTDKILVLSKMIGVVDSGEFAIISDVENNCIKFGSSQKFTTTKNAHCFGIIFINKIK